MENETIRLIPASEELAAQAADFYRRNREFFRSFDPVREEAFFTEAGQRVLLRQEVENRRENRGYRFFIQSAGDPGTVIGTISLSNVVWGAFRSAHLGYKLDREWTGRGLMTMAVEMVTRYAFEELGLHRIEANVMPKNRASLRVLEKNGYENEGLARAYLNIGGRWEDHIHMVLLNEKMK